MTKLGTTYAELSGEQVLLGLYSTCKDASNNSQKAEGSNRSRATIKHFLKEVFFSTESSERSQTNLDRKFKCTFIMTDVIQQSLWAEKY